MSLVVRTEFFMTDVGDANPIKQPKTYKCPNPELMIVLMMCEVPSLLQNQK